MYEHRSEPLLSQNAFLWRLLSGLALSGTLIMASLALGVIGYRFLGGLGWLDALLNASMILTGMGPVNPMRTTSGKLFAAGYALFSGVAFLTGVGVLLAPVVHRFLHRFHLDMEDGS